MREVTIGAKESGQRFSKFLEKYFKEAQTSFLYKMLRKKNIKLNDKKATGSEMLQTGDKVTVYFSDETFEKFRGETKKVSYPVIDLDIVYEDEDVLIVNKPAGMLSQKAKPQDVTLVEYILGYLQKKGEWSPKDSLKPGICNRLDRNTSGLVIAGKSLRGRCRCSPSRSARTSRISALPPKMAACKPVIPPSPPQALSAAQARLLITTDHSKSMQTAAPRNRQILFRPAFQPPPSAPAAL